MAELKKLLSALIKGTGSFEQTHAAIRKYLARSPEKAPQVAKLLRAAREAGLSHPMYVSLSGSLAAHPEAAPDPDATSLALDDESEHPVRTPPPDALTAAEGPQDALIPSPEDDGRTQLNAGSSEEDRTMLLSRDGEVSGEPTLMEAGLDDDATAINADLETARGNGEALDDATEINPDADEWAAPTAEATEKTIAASREVDFDVFSDEPFASAEETAEPDTGASWPTIRGSRVAGVSRTFREGDHLRNRFQLLSKLGEGGMGAVWKGKDLLKEEARDRNPFVAIKLLQGDFKEHPEAFIALQRETAKQQRLAHPNIATVYDFDRDDSTNTVFMTMEVLEGQPLDMFIRKLPQGGLEVDKAMPLIEQLCNGLEYAHSHGLVHADLKPGNCFYTKDGIIKLLDFGIARASKTKADAEGETTLFDPSALGALTPTYATVEMFDGADPDPRDDIYALAIMTYQLLTGKHPYGKKPAPKARELGLKPAPVAKLNKRQNKALMRGLAFEREQRTPTVEEFFDSIRPKKNRVPALVAATIAGAMIIGAGAYNPVVDMVNKFRREQIVSVIAEGGLEDMRRGLEQAAALGDQEQMTLVLNDPRTKDAIVAYAADGGDKKINKLLALIEPYDPNWQRDIKEAEAVKSAVMNIYKSRIHGAFNVKEDRYDFVTASDLIAELDRLYPDSAKVLQERTRLSQEKAMKLAELSQDYTRFLEQGRLLPEKNVRDIGDVFNVVKQIDPEHALLTDDRLRFRYGELAEQAIDEKAYGRADALLRASLSYAPGDSKLTDLRFRVQAELQRIANERRVAEIEQRLAPRLATLNALDDYLAIGDDLIALGDLDPDSKLLASIQRKLKQSFSARFKSGMSKKNWGQSERVLADYAVLFDIPFLMQQRALLSSAEGQAGYMIEMTPERQAAVKERVQTISALLAKPEFSSEWETRLKSPYKELIALLPANDPILDQVRTQTARLYLQNAKSALESERFVEALAFVERGRVFYPELKNFEEFEQAIAVAQDHWRKRREEEQRLARIDALKNEFMAAAERNDVQDADVKLTAIRVEGLDAEDPFLTREAPRELAGAYFRLARGRIESERPDFEQGLTLAARGLELAPDFEALRTAFADWQVQAEKRKLEIALRKLFDSTGAIDVAATQAGMQRLEAEFADRFSDLRREFAEARADQIRGLAHSKELRISSLSTRMAEYETLFPQEAPALRDSVAAIVDERIRAVRIASAADLKALAPALSQFRAFSTDDYAALSQHLSSTLATRIRALDRSDKLEAAALLQASIDQFGEAPFRGISIELPMKEIYEGMKQAAAGRLTAAKSNLAAAKRKDPGHKDLPAFENALQAALSSATSEYQRYAQAASASRSPRDQARFDSMFASIQQQWSDNPEFRRIQISPPRRGECSQDLAGYGRRRGGECWDMIGPAKGPLMVVIPAGGAVAKPFAISKYEISGRDFNDYCKATGRCKSLSRSRARLPVTTVSVQEAEAYARWLSEQATRTESRKVVYRLPSEAEWEHAATAAGSQPEKKYNCRVTSGGSVISGHALVDAASGAQNGWGLANYVGNAQEWVRAAGGLKARGGTFEDPLSGCDVSISRSHSGQPDGMTGFRLVREMG